MRQLEAKYGLPRKVIFCKRCVMSNQRPASAAEFRHTINTRKTTLHINEDGVCDACTYAEEKEKINWKKREQDLIKLLDKHRRKDGRYDCIVPGSGGKDSCYAAHILKYKYGMNPLTVTWPPILYTDYGYQNFKNWIDIGGFDNIAFTRNGKAMKILTKLAIENLYHPFQTFMLGQKNIAPKIAIRYDVPLVFYGENEVEYGNPIAESTNSLRDKSYYAARNINAIHLAGLPIKEIVEKYDLTMNDLLSFLPADSKSLEKAKIEVH